MILNELLQKHIKFINEHLLPFFKLKQLFGKFITIGQTGYVLDIDSTKAEDGVIRYLMKTIPKVVAVDRDVCFYGPAGQVGRYLYRLVEYSARRCAEKLLVYLSDGRRQIN